MNVYKVDYNDFFSLKHDAELRSNWLRFNKLCEQPMAELISRYNLRSKRVLSIGASYGHEEYWLYQNRCELTFVDIDEGKKIETYLKQIAVSGNAQNSDRLLTYAIGDARDYGAENEKKFDVCYFSSFTPNELRNADVYSKIPKSFANRALRRLSLKIGQGYVGWSWPQDIKPFMDLVPEIANSSLEDGGQFFYQSYASGVDIRTQNYLLLIDKQLNSLGINLVDVYYFIGYPSVHLVVGYKGKSLAARQWADTIKNNNPELSSFHGRSHDLIEFKGIKKIYDILQV